MTHALLLCSSGLQTFLITHSYICKTNYHAPQLFFSVFLNHTLRHTVGLLWTSDQPVGDVYLHRTT
jgi:hypothetical protein